MLVLSLLVVVDSCYFSCFCYFFDPSGGLLLLTSFASLCLRPNGVIVDPLVAVLFASVVCNRARGCGGEGEDDHRASGEGEQEQDGVVVVGPTAHGDHRARGGPLIGWRIPCSFFF